LVLLQVLLLQQLLACRLLVLLLLLGHEMCFMCLCWCHVSHS
jgi:hypothetical protein